MNVSYKDLFIFIIFIRYFQNVQIYDFTNQSAMKNGKNRNDDFCIEPELFLKTNFYQI